MSFLSRQQLLVWQAGSWQFVCPNVYLAELSTPSELSVEPNLSFSQAFEQLPEVLSHLKGRLVGLVLANHWLEIGQRKIADDIPTELFPLAAHTYAGEISALADQERVFCFQVTTDEQERVCDISVLAKDHFDRLREYVSCPVFSAATLAANKRYQWNKAHHHQLSFQFFRFDYLEQRQARRMRRILAWGYWGIALISLVFSALLYWHTPPEVEAFVWPWPAHSQSHNSFATALKYLRSLPTQARLDEVQVTDSHIEVRVTGRAKDLQLWQQNWPSHLPPLVIKIEMEDGQ